VAIQSPETLANKLFSRRVIDTCVKEKVHLPTLTTHEKCHILLNAVERQIKYRHERFYKFVHALQDEPTMEDLSCQLIEDVASKCFTNCSASVIAMPFSLIVIITSIHWFMTYRNWKI